MASLLRGQFAAASCPCSYMRVSSANLLFLPLQRLCYNDPISRSSTNNDVVRKTTVRALKIVHEVNQDLPVVTYDLAIASKVVFPPENLGRQISR